MPEIDSILILIATVHAYLFSVVLLLAKQKGTKILGFYMLMTFLSYGINANMYLFKISFLNYMFFYLIPFISLTLLPLMYIYVRYVSTEFFIISKKALWHFIPSVVWFLIVLFFLQSMPSDIRYKIIHSIDKESADFQAVKLLFLLTNAIIFLQVFIYSGVMLFMLHRHKKALESIYSYKSMISLNWLIVFVSVFFAYYLFEFIVFISNGVPVNLNLYFMIITIHVFFVGIMGFRQRDIYNKMHLFSSAERVEIKNLLDNKKSTPLSDIERSIIIEQINDLMTNQRIYLNPEISLYDMANMLGIHKNYLSQIINDELGMNFFSLINSYRIEDAKKMLLDKEYNNLSIEGIAQNVGYKTRNVFYPIFKKYVGLTPSEYKKHGLENTIEGFVEK